MLEIKSTTTTCIITDVDTATGCVEVYLSESKSVDSHNDKFQHGAWANTINSGKDRPFLWNHELNKMPIGILKGNEFREDDFGLRAIGKLNKTSLGNDALICYQEGHINQHSVGFYTINKKATANGVRIITEANLVEGSAVNIASNPNTHVISLKSATEILSEYQKLEKRSRALYKMLTTGNLSDEFCMAIAAEHSLITAKMGEIIEALTKKEPEVNSTPEVIVEPQENKSAINVYAEFMKTYK